MKSIIWIVLAFSVGILVGWCANIFSSPSYPAGRIAVPLQPDVDINTNKNWQHVFTNSRVLLEQHVREFNEEGKSSSPSKFLYALVQDQAAIDPLGTARLIIDAEMGQGSAKTNLLRTVARVWYAIDGLQILEALRMAAPYVELQAFYHPVFTMVANEQPLEALSHILALPDPELRNQLFINVTHAIQPGDVPQIATIIEGFDTKDRMYITLMTGDQLAKKDPEYMLIRATAYSKAEAAVINEAAVRKIVSTDPMRAIELAQALQLQDTGGVLLRAAEIIARTDPHAARQLFEATENPTWKQRMIGSLSKGWASHDPEGAALWVSTLDPVYASDSLQTLGHDWGKEDLAGATAFAVMLPDEQRENWLRGVSASFRYSDTDTYLRWLDQFQGEPLYTSLLSETVFSLHRADPDLAGRYVRSLNANVRSAPLTELIEKVGEYDPRTASTWLAEITDPDFRREATRRLVRDWKEKSLEDLSAWVDSLPSGELKDEALSALAVYSRPENWKTLVASIENRETRIRTLIGQKMPLHSAHIAAEILEQLGLTEEQWRRLEATVAAPLP